VRRRIEAAVYSRRRSWGEIGAGVLLTRDSVRQLERLEMGRAVEERGVRSARAPLPPPRPHVQTATITAYGWRANVHNPGVGRHFITTTIVVDGDSYPFDHVIDIVTSG
jgi:hypothetical protein